MPLLQAISASAIPRLPDFPRQEVANIAWAFSKLVFMDEPLRYAISSQALALQSQFDGQGLVNLAWSEAVWR
jgi:hypothetical protein